MKQEDECESTIVINYSRSKTESNGWGYIFSSEVIPIIQGEKRIINTT